MSTERKSLESAFAGAPSTRSDGLSGLLPPRAPQSDHDKAVPRPANSDAKPAKRTDTARKAPRRASERATNNTPLNVGIYLEPALLEKVTARRKADDVTYADVLVDAFDSVDVDAVTARFTAAPTADTSGRMPRAARPTRGQGGIQRQFRLTVDQRDYLDRLVESTSSPSRSALVAAVLEAYVQQRGSA